MEGYRQGKRNPDKLLPTRKLPLRARQYMSTKLSLQKFEQAI